MSSSAEIRINGNGNADHDHILRPRAVKPPNPAVLRAMNDDGYLAAGKEAAENGGSTGGTR
jgi:sterol O-acyltransferase